MPDTNILRRFLDSTPDKVVAIERDDLLALCEAAERALAMPPRVPALMVGTSA